MKIEKGYLTIIITKEDDTDVSSNKALYNRIAKHLTEKLGREFSVEEDKKITDRYNGVITDGIIYLTDYHEKVMLNTDINGQWQRVTRDPKKDFNNTEFEMYISGKTDDIDAFLKEVS